MIYVFIPSRLDRELIPTCYDLVQKAANPDNIRIIVFNQDRKEDMFFQDQFPPQVTLINVDYRVFSNICYVRSLASSFIEPKDKYYLGIDSHMRFDPNWDDILIKALRPNSILSAYPAGYQVFGTKLPLNNLHLTNSFNIDKDGPFPFVSKPLEVKQDYEKSTFAGGYHFTSIDWLKNVGYDKHLCWKFEEIDLTYRSIANNYTIENYKHTPIYHLYDKTHTRKQVDNQERFLTDCNLTFEKKLNEEDNYKINQYYGIDFFKYIVGYLK